MTITTVFSERRRGSRNGAFGRVENVTYSVLRRYGISAERGLKSPGFTDARSADLRPQGNESLFTSHNRSGSLLIAGGEASRR